MKTKSLQIDSFYTLLLLGRFTRGQKRSRSWWSSWKGSFWASCLLILFASVQAFGQTPAIPFGSNAGYPYGTMQTIQSASASDDLSKEWYGYWSGSFIKGCGTDKAFVVYDYGGQNAYSEGQGYGMLLAAYYGDKTTFDKLAQGYWSSRNSHGLMNWTVSCSNPNIGSNGATDGDLDAAMALLIANKQWPNTTSPIDYSKYATTLINNIKNYEFVTCNGKIVQKAGDYLGGCNCTNPSYYATGYYRAFAKHVPADAAFWNQAADDGLDLLIKATDPNTGLNPAWTDQSGSITSGGSGDCNNIAAPGGGARTDFQFDAARTPWRIVVDYLWWGTPKAKTYLDKITNWANSKGINKIMAGHHLNGDAYLTYTNSAFVGAFAVGAMGTTNQSVVNNFYKYWTDNSMTNQDWSSGKTLDDKPYFQNSLRTVYSFVASGNFWNPYASSTPSNQSPTVSITSPSNNQSYTAPASITINANASDPDGSISKVEFYNGSTLLGTDNNSPYSFTWSNVGAGTYTITVKATDNAGAVTTSAAITVTVNAPNQAPAISITNPSNNQSFTAPATVTINTNASDPDGLISKVEFYNGSNLLGTANNSPYSFTWTNVTAGTYTITAKATDNAGAVTTSSAITITVAAPNQSPTVSITSPSNNQSYTAPATITINANASDPDGSISNVQFYNGSNLLGSDNNSPYSFTWTNVTAGTYTITAKATDNSGAVTTSSAITVTVSAPNQSPTVSITSPANNASYMAPATITIDATASDADGSISNVQFYNGSTLLGSDNTSPYSFTWANVTAGSYTITAKATDNSGAVTTSAAITVTVNTPSNQSPSVTITAPASGTTYTAPASVTLSANASDPDGSITSVEFYNGSTLLGSDNTEPYSFTWSNVAAGSYTITAKATDNAGATATSAEVQIIVNSPANQLPMISITAPSNGSTFTAPATITISANASDPDGSVSNVEFYNGPALLGSDNTAPYSFNWSNVAVGTYTITAKATDNAGGVTTSTSVTITVNPADNQPPVVSITSPAGGASFSEPASITITASATDADGSITNVQFYNGSTLLGSDNTSPYTFTWTNVAAGSYTITAKATDNSGSVVTSSPVTVTVTSTTSEGGATIQAETACSVEGTLNETANGGFRGTGYINTVDATGATATWVVNSPSAQTVSLGIRYATATNPGRPMSLSVNGTTQVSNIDFGNSGGMSSWVVANVSVNLAAGANTIKLVALTDEGSPYIDELTFGSSTVTAGTCPATTGTTIQAETACSVDGTLNETANGGFEGTGYVNTNDAVGASASWVVNSGTAQTVSLGIRYATATTPGRPMSLSVNGTTQVANIAFAYSGGMSAWVVINVDVNLAAGANTIKLVSLTDEGSPYVDELIFGSSTVTAGTCPVSSGSSTIQAETACSVDGTLNETANGGFRGTGYVNTNDAVGASASWVVNSETAQTVSLGIRYATATNPGRPMSLSVNGTTQVANIAFANTGGISTWGEANVDVTLAAGANTIKLVALTNEGSPYVDELIFGSSTVTAGTCTPNTNPGGTDCSVDAIPAASNWIVRNDWSDQYSNSHVSNSGDALQISHRAWGRNYLWVIQNGVPVSLVSGQTYTVSFDFKNDASNPATSVDVAFGKDIQWNGPTLAQPSVTAPSGYSSSSYTTKSVTFTAATTGTVYLAFRLNWPGQPSQTVNTFVKNINVCGASSSSAMIAAAAAPVNYEVVPNPVEGNANAMIVIKAEETVPVTVTITDLSGLVVYSSNENYTNQGFYVGNNFKAGVYLVKAVCGQEVTTFRFVKN